MEIYQTLQYQQAVKAAAFSTGAVDREETSQMFSADYAMFHVKHFL
jgi:hypothetical protein